jgi:hypothetical protein
LYGRVVDHLDHHLHHLARHRRGLAAVIHPRPLRLLENDLRRGARNDTCEEMEMACGAKPEMARL